ncbi:MAG TPA: hypothetical protein VMT32_01750 [Bryobacteraceae bacterium]|nr:hypothetical protein [Bryobacteraceae bacterium]
MNNDSGAGSRREFLQSAAGLSGALALQASAEAGEAPLPRLPVVKFGKTEITRLIIGSNPFYGYSHFNHIFDAQMREFYTQDKKMEVLKSAERNGIGTWQLHYNDQPLADYLRYRQEGGKMNIVLLADFELMKNPKIMPDVVAKMKPLGIGHHGNWTDNRFRAGEKGKVRDFCKMVRDTGVMVGVSAHNPGVFDIIESEDWDVDYFQACLYRVSRTVEEARAEFGEATVGETYMEKDPERMCKIIRATKKPCLAFKVFGAGRSIGSAEEMEKAVRFALANIKPTDAIIMGVYPKFSDQVKENAELVRRILA